MYRVVESLREKLREKLREWLGMDGLEEELVNVRAENKILWRQLQEFLPHLEIHADVHMRSASWIIAIGRWKHHDYVRAFSVDARSFDALVERLCREFPKARVGHWDLPRCNHPTFSTLYDRERL